MANKYLALQKDVFDISKVTVVGSPTITSDGVASGFSGSNYIRIPYRALGQNFKIFTPRFNSSDVSQQQKIVRYSDGNIRIEIYQNKIRLYRYSGNNVYDLPVGKTTLQNNTDYYYYVEQTTDGTNYYLKCYISTDNKNWTLDVDKTYTSAMYDYQNNAPIQISGADANQPFIGTLGLKQFKIYVDGQLVFQPTKPAYLLERRKPKVWNKGQFTVVGNPSISENGVASGFDGNNFIKIPISTKLSEADSWKIIIENNSLYGDGYLFGGNLLNTIAYLKGAFWISSNGTSWDVASSVGTRTNIPANSLIQLEFTGSKYISKYSTDNGLNWNITGELDSNVKITDKLNTLYVGVIIGGNPANCSVNLKSIKIYTDNNLVFDGGAETYVYDPSKFTIVGSPTITEYGVASGFSISPLNRIALSFDINAKENITIECGVIYKDDMKGATFAFDNSTRLFIGYQNVNLWTDVTTNVIPATNYLTSMNVSNGDLLKAKLILTNNTAQVIVSVKNQTFATNIKTSNIPLNITFIHFGSSDVGVFTGSIDLPSISITVDNKEVFTGAKENYYMLRR